MHTVIISTVTYCPIPTGNVLRLVSYSGRVRIAHDRKLYKCKCSLKWRQTTSFVVAHHRDPARRFNGQESLVWKKYCKEPANRIEIDCTSFRSSSNMAFTQVIAPSIGFEDVMGAEDIYQIPISENTHKTTENDMPKKGPQLSRKQQKELTKAQREEDNNEPPKITGKEVSFFMLPVSLSFWIAKRNR